jgi:protein TonB
MNNKQLFSGILAFFVYFSLLALLFYYFNYHSASNSLHYVEKNDNRIEVAMGAQEKKKASKKKSASKKSPTKKKPKPQPDKKPLPKPEPKAVEPEPKKEEEPKPTDKPRLLEKQKPIEKPKPKPKPKPEPKKKPEPKSLFDNVDTDKPKVDEKQEVAEESVEQKEKISENKKKSDSLKNVKNSDMGVVDAYKAKIEKKLQDWPAQSEFAGETLVMRLKIYPDGTFEFKILTPSNNEDFNNGLVQYLQQLQRIGFDSHSNGKPYEFDVEFIAKE